MSVFTPPEGMDFLKLVLKQEDACELATDERLPNMGEKAPACLEQIGTVLSLLDRMASCWWKCGAEDHVVEYLCGRVSSSGRAALRLMKLGFYDESLVLSRAIGEIANLLVLFQQDKTAFEEWKTASRRDRMIKFTPFKVRVRLESLDTSSPISRERYQLLSERAAHVNPDTKPQSHNILGVPWIGAMLQEEGLLVCLNELAVALSISLAYGALMLDLDQDVKMQAVTSARDLGEQIGAATITEIDDYYREVREDAAVRETFDLISAIMRRNQERMRKSIEHE